MSLRSDRPRTLLALLVVATAGPGGCSPGRYEHRACQTDRDCREVFGFGAACGGEGFCEEVDIAPRCGATYPVDLFDAPDRHRGTLVLGSLMDRSSEAHVTRERAIRLAVKQANDKGGLDGRPLGLVMCDIREKADLDARSRTEAAVASAGFLAEKLGVPAIVGPCASTDTEKVWQAVRGAGTLVFSPAATSPALGDLEVDTSDERPGLLWRAAPTDAMQGRVIAEDMLSRKVTRAQVIRETGGYGEGLAAVFAEHFRKGGGSLELVSVSDQAQVVAAAAGPAAGTGAAEDQGPDEVLFVSSQQAWIVAFLAAAAAQEAYAQRTLFLTDAAANQAVFAAAAPEAAALFPRVRGTRPAPRDPDEFVYASFIADFRREYGGATPEVATFSAHAFDATWLTLYGAAWSQLQQGRVDGAGIARGLARVSDGVATPILPSSWPGVLAAFRAGQSINASGTSGELDYDRQSREVRAAIEIWTVAPMGAQFNLVPVGTRLPGSETTR